MEKKNPINYVNNKEFYASIIEYREKVIEANKLGVDKPEIPRYIGECIMKISTNLAKKPKFANYSYKDEMILDAIEDCIKAINTIGEPNDTGGIKGFDPDKTNNPFAYFTQIAFNAFRRRLNEESRKRYILYKSFVDHIGVDDLSLMSDSDGNVVCDNKLYDNIYEFMRTFEDKEEEKKRIRKEKKEGVEKYIE